MSAIPIWQGEDAASIYDMDAFLDAYTNHRWGSPKQARPQLKPASEMLMLKCTDAPASRRQTAKRTCEDVGVADVLQETPKAQRRKASEAKDDAGEEAAVQPAPSGTNRKRSQVPRN